VKIHGYDPEYNINLSGASGVISSNYSTTSLGSNTPLADSGGGSPGTGPQAAPWDHVHPASGSASFAFGSNSNDVSTANAGGASSSNSRSDHVHRGVRSLAKAGSSALFGDVTLTGGSNVTLTQTGQDISIASTGGSSGATIQYPGLKPGTPTYDFAGAALDGAFTARSNTGSFATTNCKTQGEDWGGSALDMQYSVQNGGLYVAHGNTDLDFHVGGIRKKGMSNAGGLALMIGIAALNSSGTGVGLVVYNDSHIYLATITTWNYTGNSDSWLNHGQGVDTGYDGDWWLRLTRVSGTWTAYASQSGRAWDETFATRADSITVDRLYFGVLFNTATSYSGRITADYFQVDV
jgi:hypothetical protein